MTLDAAMEIALRGIAIFPAKDKKPLVRWQNEASADPDQIKQWWARWPDAEVGVPMPLGTVAVDIDDYAVVRQANLEWVPTLGQQTRSGGYHFFYRTDGRPVPQVVKRGGIALDTRVGGKGYVIAYYPPALDPSHWTPAPDWVYETERPERTESPAPAVLSTRTDILSFLGKFSARGLGLSEAEYRVLLLAKRKAGGIVDTDPKRPWTDDDLAKLAFEASKFEVSQERGLDLQSTASDEGMDAVDLLLEHIDPLRWAVQDLMPEGFGLLASPPKVGKSLLCYQLAVALTLGTTLLDRTVEKRPVRYYALEDGKRRSQSRIASVLQGQPIPRGLELRWRGPHLGGPLEVACDEWLTEHPLGVIIIDVLAKVRPVGGGRGKNAYDEDYALLAGLHQTATNHPGSVILLVTHDRKAGSDDWMTRITGTRGVPGVADFSIFIDRKRGKSVATISSTGRDQPDLDLMAEFTGEGWRTTDITRTEARELSETRRRVLDYIAVSGPVSPALISAATGLGSEVVRSQLHRMKGMGDIKNTATGYVVASEASDDDD